MAIIISQNGKNAQKIDKSPIDKEDYLQNYIHENPDAIPVYEIDENIRLFVAAREFPTESGPIDALAFDESGNIYLVETKLYKNPDKRTVVAQVMDYGASLWQHSSNPVDFQLSLDRFSQKYHDDNFLEAIQSFFNNPEFEAESFMERIYNNLQEGSFKFVVLMDTLEDRLKDLIIFLNQKSKFDIYAVELEYYQHDSFEIIIPRLFGAEVKKDISRKKSDVSFISDEDFVSLYKDTQLATKVNDIFKLHEQIKTGVVKFDGWGTDRTPKNLNFFYKSPGQTKKSLVISVAFNRDTPDDNLTFWLYERDIEEKVLESIRNVFRIECILLSQEAKYGVIARWPIEDYSENKLVAFFALL